MTGEDLLQRLDRIESIQEITRLKHTYWHYNDTGLRGSEIASLFTADGAPDVVTELLVRPDSERGWAGAERIRTVG